MKKITYVLTLVLATVLAACSNDDDSNPALPTNDVTFRVTVKNAINLLSTKTYNSRYDAAGQPIGNGPLMNTGDYYEVNFKAVPGTYLSFANMFAQSNDWFFAPSGQGIALFDSNGVATTGDISSEIAVWDAGTEENENFLTDLAGSIYIATNQSAPNSGPADSNPLVRDTGRNILNYMSASLAYDSTTRYFTLRVTKANREGLENPGFVTPGVLVVHAQPNALFEAGAELPENGLEALAEDGDIMPLYNWLSEAGSQGAPLRLASSLTPLSPGIVYTFSSDSDPLFTQGESVKANSGLKELAEDGNNEVIFNYLTANDITAARSEQPGGVGANGELTFTINAVPGDKLGFATMFVAANDWFISYNNNGVALFDADGNPRSGDLESENTYLFDAGTELDEDVGFGDYQPMGSNGTGSAGADPNPIIRRVGEIEDVQFGKGLIESAPGVTALSDGRGGYNLVVISVEPQS